MTREEYEKLKAEEREHLEKMRALKTAVRRLDQQRSMAGALERLQSSARDLIERHEDLVDELARETAHMEARAEMGMEAESAAASNDALAQSEEELTRLRAQKLIEEIKQEVASAEASSEKPQAPVEPSSDRTKKQDDARPPEKTIGRMR